MSTDRREIEIEVVHQILEVEQGWVLFKKMEATLWESQGAERRVGEVVLGEPYVGFTLGISVWQKWLSNEHGIRLNYATEFELFGHLRSLGWEIECEFDSKAPENNHVTATTGIAVYRVSIPTFPAMTFTPSTRGRRSGCYF